MKRRDDRRNCSQLPRCGRHRATLLPAGVLEIEALEATTTSGGGPVLFSGPMFGLMLRVTGLLDDLRKDEAVTFGGGGGFSGGGAGGGW